MYLFCWEFTAIFNESNQQLHSIWHARRLIKVNVYLKRDNIIKSVKSVQSPQIRNSLFGNITDNGLDAASYGKRNATNTFPLVVEETNVPLNIIPNIEQLTVYYQNSGQTIQVYTVNIIQIIQKDCFCPYIFLINEQRCFSTT